MTIYLVDYENVNADSFMGLEQLEDDDIVVVFYSERCNKLPFSLHNRIIASKKQIEYMEAQNGSKNSLDFQLATYLGYLVAKNKECGYVIVSCDSGFNALINFWKKENVSIARARNLAAKPLKDEPMKVEPIKTREEVAPAAEIPMPEAEPQIPEVQIEASASEENTTVVNVTEAIAPENDTQETSAPDSPSSPEQVPTDAASTPKEKPEVSEVPKLEPKKPQNKKSSKKGKSPVRKENDKDNMTERLDQLLSNFQSDIPAVKECIEKYKTKQGINNALTKKFGSEKTGAIYKAIKPLLSEKKGS